MIIIMITMITNITTIRVAPRRSTTWPMMAPRGPPSAWGRRAQPTG